MSGSHDFCVTRSTESNQEKFRASFKYGDIDAGKEAARVIVSQKFRTAGTISVGVFDYDRGLPGRRSVRVHGVRNY